MKRQHYVIEYDEHKDKYCLMEVLVDQELKLHSMYNTFDYAKYNVDILNEQYQKSLASQHH